LISIPLWRERQPLLSSTRRAPTGDRDWSVTSTG